MSPHPHSLGTRFHRFLRAIAGKGKKNAGKRTAQLKVDDAIASAPTTEQLRAALLTLQEQLVPASVQENVGYFMTQFNLGEEMARKGEFFVHTHFSWNLN